MKKYILISELGFDKDGKPSRSVDDIYYGVKFTNPYPKKLAKKILRLYTEGGENAKRDIMKLIKKYKQERENETRNREVRGS